MNMLVTDTACLCLIPVCMLFQDTRVVLYTHNTKSDLCVHTKVQRTYPKSVTDTAFLY